MLQTQTFSDLAVLDVAMSWIIVVSYFMRLAEDEDLQVIRPGFHTARTVHDQAES